MAMVKSSAVKKSRRKSQREAARIQRQTDAALAMEEEEEIVFKRLRTVPNTPRASRGQYAGSGRPRGGAEILHSGLTDGQDRTRPVDSPGLGQH